MGRGGERGRATVGVVASVGLTALALTVGTATADFDSPWYLALRKPRWQPSGAVIGAVWSVLYPLIAVAGGVLAVDEGGRRDRPLLALFGAQAVLNAAYTPLLTRSRALGLATLDCALLALVAAALARRAWAVRRPAGVLLLPYALWTAFATALSARLWSLNARRPVPPLS